MDRVSEQAQAQCERLIEATPETLRALANQLESMATHGLLPDQVVRIPVCRGIAFVYKPHITRQTIAAQPAYLREVSE